MHITYVHPFFHRYGGAEIHILWMLRDALKRGHECRIVTGRFNRDVPEFASAEGAGAHVIETGWRTGGNPWRERLRALPGIRNWLRRNQAATDVACFVNWPTYWAAEDYPRDGKVTRVHLLLEPTLGWATEPYPFYKRPFVRLMRARYENRDRRAMNAVDLTLCHTDEMREHVMNVYGREAVSTGLGIDTGRYLPDVAPPASLTLDPEKFNILTPAKGLRAVLPAFAMIRRKRPDATLHVLGGEASGDGVCSLPFQNESDMPGLYGAMDLLWLHSPREPWGLVVVEALACGTPVLTHGSGGPAHIVESEAVGWKYSTLADAELLLADPQNISKQQCASMAAACRALAVKKYQWQHTADLYDRLIRTARAQRRGGA